MIDGTHQTTLWACQTCPYQPRPTVAEPRKLILKNYLSPGDVLVMTAAIHSLHKAYPGKFRVAVDTSAQAFFEHSPDVEPLEKAREEKWEEVQMHYPLIQECNQRAVHFLEGYVQYLNDNLQVPVRLSVNRPQIWLSNEEKAWMNQVEEQLGYKGRFWVVNAGRKSDFTCKHWGTENFQRLVDLLRGKIVFVQIGSSEHHHPPLKNVLNLVGKTDLRQLVRLFWHADGVVTGVSMPHHLAAALEKPSVTVMGGREPVTWNSYPKCQLLHTVGSLSCCRSGGCWKSRTVALPDNAEQNGSLCEQPQPGEPALPRCMVMIKPERVAEAVAVLTAG
jgi:ADP-heptose:LPS heptosyltransferase